MFIKVVKTVIYQGLMDKNLRIIFRIKATLLIVSILFFELGVNAQESANNGALEKVETALQIINYAYVEEVDQDQLIEQSIIATLQELDPYSKYYSKEELKKSNEELNGNFEGIGISYQIYHDTINIVAPVADGPAERAGIKGGDKIIRVNGMQFTGDILTEDFISSQMRGEKGSNVEITVIRGSTSRKELNFTVYRDNIRIKSVVAHYMVNDQIGYVKIDRFARTTVDEFRVAVEDLRSQGMRSLILDLRGNAGGYFDAAVDLTDEFLTHGKLICYTQGASSPKRRYKASYIGSFLEGNVAVLIDESSASASEIVAGALQDWGRAVIIGRRSYGKGLVQRPYYLPDSSVIRLTIAKYYSPTGRCIQKPYRENQPDYLKELEEKLAHGEIISSRNLHFPDSLKYVTDNSRIVFGGGGIMPDIYVTIDSLRLNPLYIQLIEQDIINGFVMEYMFRHREELEKTYENFNEFNEYFSVDNLLITEFRTFAKSRDLFIDPFKFEPLKNMVSNDLKSLVARHLFGIMEYHQLMNRKDKDFFKAVEVLESNSILAELNID